jgi:hypothetical protein
MPAISATPRLRHPHADPSAVARPARLQRGEQGSEGGRRGQQAVADPRGAQLQQLGPKQAQGAAGR